MTLYQFQQIATNYWGEPLNFKRRKSEVQDGSTWPILEHSEYRVYKGQREGKEMWYMISHNSMYFLKVLSQLSWKIVKSS